MDSKSHWENIYTSKNPEEVSWFQPKPEKSIQLINEVMKDKNLSIIDAGGGASILIHELLIQGFTDLTVLDISAAALEISKNKNKDAVNKISWIAEDVTKFQTNKKFDVWHDRAVFHFLRDPELIAKYKKVVSELVGEYLIISTFALDGPKKCSGLEIEQYDEIKIQDIFKDKFKLIKSIDECHVTPNGSEQKFKYFILKKGD